jgi:hypothetical protein
MAEEFKFGCISFVIGACLAGFIGYNISKDSIQMKIDHEAAIKTCEATLPRNRHCDAVWTASVRPLKVTLTGRGTNGKDIVIEQELDAKGKPVKASKKVSKKKSKKKGKS